MQIIKLIFLWKHFTFFYGAEHLVRVAWLGLNNFDVAFRLVRLLAKLLQNITLYNALAVHCITPLLFTI